jgi:hypothetical protein
LLLAAPRPELCERTEDAAVIAEPSFECWKEIGEPAQRSQKPQTMLESLLNRRKQCRKSAQAPNLKPQRHLSDHLAK